jgi:hypothetical protein
MYPSENARQLSILLRTSRELDIVGDVTTTTDDPSELLAWAHILPQPTICAWQGESGGRYVEVSAAHAHAPVRGQVTAVLACDQHPQFWDELGVDTSASTHQRHPLTVKDLSEAWAAMPLTPDG